MSLVDMLDAIGDSARAIAGGTSGNVSKVARIIQAAARTAAVLANQGRTAEQIVSDITAIRPHSRDSVDSRIDAVVEGLLPEIPE